MSICCDISDIFMRNHRCMKIAFVTETYPPEINGVALTVQSLAYGCRKLGHHVELTRPRQAVDAPALSNRLLVERFVTGTKLPFYSGLQFGHPDYRGLLAHWKKIRPDGVYVATEGPLGISAVLAAKKLGIPVVTGLHTRFDDFVRHYRLGLLSQPVFAFMRYFHNKADATLVPTLALQSMLKSRGFKAVKLLARAVNTKSFSPSFRQESLRASWGCDAQSFAVLHVGRFASEKNLGLCGKAFDALAAAHANVRFRMIWVGDGPVKAELQKELSADPRHVFCGMLRAEALSAAYASADMFLFPSLSETFGNVTLEALASGVPVCAFDYAAAAETIQNGINGQTAPFADSEKFISAGITLTQQVLSGKVNAINARASVVNLNPTHVAGALVDLLADIGKSSSTAALQLTATPSKALSKIGESLC